MGTPGIAEQRSTPGPRAILVVKMSAVTEPPGGPPPPSPPKPPLFVRELDTMIRARYPLVYLVSWEEQRLDAILEDLARTHGKAFHVWTSTQGLRKIAGARFV